MTEDDFGIRDISSAEDNSGDEQVRHWACNLITNSKQELIQHTLWIDLCGMQVITRLQITLLLGFVQC